MGSFDAYGQRASLLKTKNNSLVLLSFTNRKNKGKQTSSFNNSKGTYKGRGMFVAISEDLGKSWPWKKLLTHIEDDSSILMNGGGNTGIFKLSRTEAEPAGYTVLVETPNQIIHAFSSRLHYQFNLNWVKSLPDWK